MTLLEVYRKSADALSFGGAGEFETKVLFEDVLKVQTPVYDYSMVNATDEQIALMDKLIERRKKGEPLQYIVGSWSFYGLEFAVGEGVLIPRPETELLVEYVLKELKNINNIVVYDLCSGSGCIGLTVAKIRPDADVYLFEKEDKAFEYTKKNAEKFNLKNVNLVKCDIFDFDFSLLPLADAIISNPPYIKTDEIPLLQTEVRHEPVSSLDGGKDGLDFYRCIASKWSKKLKKGGLIAMECGDGQSSDIISVFDSIKSEKNVVFDFNDIDRIVTFRI